MTPAFKDPGRIEFIGSIAAHEGGGAFVEFPHDVEKLFGVKGRVPVRVTFDGLAYRGSMVRMGMPRHILLILKEIRESLGKGPGDRVKVTVELDEAPRVVELAPDVEAAYRKGRVLDIYRGQSFSHQRERNLWIEEAKQAATRARRIAKSVDDLRGRKS
ncbi:MAG: YdeI/OmpD-associated family protein [Acidobacteria bacterium]|jgi:bifunctional DNA-binding transcriptional regulator/antitoxin component of YhaV-PrlF toxin-antitoxin module|nr:YdeI/OmpD-associated family protein [Acidobacteriota bacterium]